MTVFWEQFLFSSRTRFNLLLQFYHQLLAHLPVLLLLSQLLPQFLMTNLRWLAMVKKLFNLVVVVVTFVMRLKPLLLLTDSLSKETPWRQCQFTSNPNGNAARWLWRFLCSCQPKQPQHLQWWCTGQDRLIHDIETWVIYFSIYWNVRRQANPNRQSSFLLVPLIKF